MNTEEPPLEPEQEIGQRRGEGLRGGTERIAGGGRARHGGHRRAQGRGVGGGLAERAQRVPG